MATAKTTGKTSRDDRAGRRAASSERVAAKTAKPSEVTALDTGGGAATLATAEIRPATGNTPLGATITMGSLDDDEAGGDGGAGSAAGRQDQQGDDSGLGGGDRSHADDPHDGATGMPDTVTVDVTTVGDDNGRSGAGRTPGAAPPRAAGWGASPPAPRPIVVREKVKSLKLRNFKGLDDTMPVTMWLKTVRAEVRRQAVTMGVEWQDNQLYHEVAAHLEGEAQRWFATVMESVAPGDENIGTLATMLRSKYQTRRSTPEVVDLLSARRQMRGERLVEYAQSLREIAEQGDISDDWLVNAFLKGMSSEVGATHVRGHRPRTLDEAVDLAIPHVGDYGEGYGVGLEDAMGRWDEREARSGRGPRETTRRSSGKEQSAVAGNLGTVVTGYGPAWGVATPAAPPRYDTEGRLVGAIGKAGATEWWKAIPPGYQLVPTSASGRGASAAGGTDPSPTGSTRGKRPASGDQDARKVARTLKVESHYGGGSAAHTPDPARATREGRLANWERRGQQPQARRAPFVPRPGTICFYCDQEGHFARFCPVKAEDLAAGRAAAAQNTEAPAASPAGNESRA